MGLFKRDWDKIHVKEAFTHVKRDTTTLHEWVQFLHKKIQQQDQTIEALQTQINNHLLTPLDIKQLIDDHFAIKNTQQLHKHLQHVNKKVDILASMHDHHNTRIKDIHNRLNNLNQVAEKKSTTLKERIIKKLTRNSKAYVKNVILSYIEKYQEVSALQLKDMLVEEQNVCSKSSFYRLLQELEDEQRVSVIKDGKQKTYLTKKLPNEQAYDYKSR
jgi:hypothetical protein